MLSRLCDDCQHRASRAGLGCEALPLWKRTLGSCFLTHSLRLCCGWQLPYSRPVVATQTGCGASQCRRAGFGIVPSSVSVLQTCPGLHHQDPVFGFGRPSMGKSRHQPLQQWVPLACGHQLGVQGHLGPWSRWIQGQALSPQLPSAVGSGL